MSLPSSPSSAYTPSNPFANGDKAHSKEDHLKITWTDTSEELIASWGDIASCYKWMHDQAFRKYDKISWRMMIPVAILSTVTGSLNMSMPVLVPENFVETGNKILGAVSIITGIITSLQSIFRFAQLSENHSNAANGWGKLERNIRIELRIDRKNRKDADNFLKICRADYDRLLESSPPIPKEIIQMFNQKFANIEHLVIPDVCGNLEHTQVNRPPPPPELLTEEAEREEEPEQPGMLSKFMTDIKQMLADSRLVSVGVKDNELPHHYIPTRSYEVEDINIPTRYSSATISNKPRKSWNQTGLQVAPRKGFLGDPPAPKKLQDVLEQESQQTGKPADMPSVNVTELRNRFERHLTLKTALNLSRLSTATNENTESATGASLTPSELPSSSMSDPSANETIVDILPPTQLQQQVEEYVGDQPEVESIPETRAPSRSRIQLRSGFDLNDLI
jgi:hypothetical protein